MSAAIKHYLNPLHVYCRLRDLGLAKERATTVCRFYERAIFQRYFLVRG